MQSRHYITFRLDFDDTDGSARVLSIGGGTHRGGLAISDVKYTGGMDVGAASEVRSMVLNMVFGWLNSYQDVLQLAFGDTPEEWIELGS